MARTDESWALSIDLPARDSTGFDASQPLPTDPPTLTLRRGGQTVLSAPRAEHIDIDRAEVAEMLADANAAPELRQRLAETEAIVRRLHYVKPRDSAGGRAHPGWRHRHRKHGRPTPSFGVRATDRLLGEPLPRVRMAGRRPRVRDHCGTAGHRAVPARPAARVRRVAVAAPTTVGEDEMSDTSTPDREPAPGDEVVFMPDGERGRLVRPNDGQCWVVHCYGCDAEETWDARDVRVVDAQRPAST